MASSIMFGILSLVILGSAVMCVMTKRIMRAATFLLFVLFGVAGIYFLLDYTFLGAAQVSVYAGGITVLYVFAIQLVSKRTLQGLVERVKCSRILAGAFVALAGFLTVAGIIVKTEALKAMTDLTAGSEQELAQVGQQLIGSGKLGYVLPFEFISLFLLACIVGGIMIARKEETK